MIHVNVYAYVYACTDATGLVYSMYSIYTNYCSGLLKPCYSSSYSIALRVLVTGFHNSLITQFTD